jgi:hypothetical protein
MAKKKRAAIEGFCRLQILDYDKDGKPTIVVGDSGMVGPNQMTDVGFKNYINCLLGADGGSLRVGYAGIGTGAASSSPASTDSTIPGEYGTGNFRRPTTWSSAASTKIRFIASWASSDQTAAGNLTVQNAGLYHTNNANSLMCGKGFTTSTWGTNQALNLTYELNLSFS